MRFRIKMKSLNSVKPSIAHLRPAGRSSLWISNLLQKPESLEGCCPEEADVSYVRRSARLSVVHIRYRGLALDPTPLCREPCRIIQASSMRVDGDTSLMKRRCDVCMKHASRQWWLRHASSKVSCFICSKIFAAYDYHFNDTHKYIL